MWKKERASDFVGPRSQINSERKKCSVHTLSIEKTRKDKKKTSSKFKLQFALFVG